MMRSGGALTRRCAALALLAGPVGVLVALLPDLPARAVRIVEPSGTTTFADLLVNLARVVACGCSAWLLVVTALAFALRGCRHGSHRLARLTPRVWRDVVLTLVGVTAMSGPAMAHAQPDRPHESGGHPTPIAGLPLPDRPSSARDAARASAPRAAPHERTQHTRRLTVRRGDSLWSIAAARLPTDAGAGEVARHCAAWYAANRRTIGDDPDLILPGMSLRPPNDEGTP